MKQKVIIFEYRMFGYSGICYGVSAAQALDNAKVRFLRQAYGITVKDASFRGRKAGLSGSPITLRLTDDVSRRFVQMYRSFKDGDLPTVDLDEFNQLSNIIRDGRITQ